MCDMTHSYARHDSFTCFATPHDTFTPRHLSRKKKLHVHVNKHLQTSTIVKGYSSQNEFVYVCMCAISHEADPYMCVSMSIHRYI